MKRKNYYQVHKNKSAKTHSMNSKNVASLIIEMTKLIKSMVEHNKTKLQLKAIRMPDYCNGNNNVEGIVSKCGCKIYYSGGFNKTVKECFDCKNQKSIFEEQLKEKLNAKGIKV